MNLIHYLLCQHLTVIKARWLVFFILMAFGQSLLAQTLTVINELQFSADIDIQFPGVGGINIYASDSEIIEFDVNSGAAVKVNPIGFSSAAGFDAFHRTGDGCGDSIYSLDSTTTIGSIALRSHNFTAYMRPADVFTDEGVKVLDADAAGIPTGINVDAVSRIAGTCDLLLSIDTSTLLSGTAYSRDDIIRWNSVDGFSLYQATNLGVNIDALHWLAPNRMLISIDVAAQLSTIDGLDDDIIEMIADGGGVELLSFDLSMINSSFYAADLNALWAMQDASFIFMDSFE